MFSRRTLLHSAALTTVIAGVGLSSCSSADPADPSAPATSGDQAEATRVVTTAQGEITVPGTPQRVVMLNYALTGLAFHLGVPVVGATTEASDVADGEPSEFWAGAAEAAGTTMLSWAVDGFAMEEIAALNPDLIVAGGVGLPWVVATDNYDRLTQIAPTVIVDKALTTWQEQLDFMAQAFGAEEAAPKLVTAFDDRIAEVRAAITPPPGPVLAVTFSEPTKPYGFMPNSSLWKLFDQLGLDPSTVAEDKGLEPYTPGGDMFEMSMEKVGELADQPSLFVCGFLNNAATVESVGKDPIFSRLPSFSSGHAYDLPNWAFRADYDQTLAVIDHIAELFG